jgi:hypothetical protein
MSAVLDTIDLQELADAQAIWNLARGFVLTALHSSGTAAFPSQSAFTQGCEYTVLSMHPLANPPHVVVQSDMGHRVGLTGRNVRENFSVKAV